VAFQDEAQVPIEHGVSGKAVAFVHHYRLESTVRRIGQEPSKFGSISRSTREANVSVPTNEFMAMLTAIAVNSGLLTWNPEPVVFTLAFGANAKINGNAHLEIPP
jgi:hypothetical protein